MSAAPPRRSVALVTLGCSRNEVDSEELAGRLAHDGWDLVGDADEADVVMVNTCGFVEAAKKDSVDTLLEAAARPAGHDRTRAVVAVGCMAERYGEQLADALPEADAVLGFDDYADISARLRSILAGEVHVSHTPRDRRTLLPLTPVSRAAGATGPGGGVAVPGHGGGSTAGSVPSGLLATSTLAPGTVAPGDGGPVVPGALSSPAFATGPVDLPAGIAPASGPPVLRRRLAGGPVAPLKIASGCDRRCAFCAIPAFRGSFLSRPPADVVAEARWLADQGVRELVLVSENSTSYGKDLGDLRSLEKLLPALAAVDGIERVRAVYLQPAEMRPGLVEVMTGTPGVVPYFDLSFQHASGPVLRRMRRFGDTERFLELLASVRERSPLAGARSNVIVGFPGETEADVAELERFLTAARLDAVGVFGYSDEDGTEALRHDGKVDEAEIRDRTERLSRLVEELTAQRAEDRIDEVLEVLVERLGPDGGEGRAAHQAPEVDGTTRLYGPGLDGRRVGDIVRAVAVSSNGVDLVAEVPLLAPAGGVLSATASRSGPVRTALPTSSAPLVRSGGARTGSSAVAAHPSSGDGAG